MGVILSDNTRTESVPDSKAKKAVGILGVPLAYGASMAGVELGPAALRVARLTRRIAQLGYQVRDLGDLHVEESQTAPEPGDKLKHLREISAACEDLAEKVEGVLNRGRAAFGSRRRSLNRHRIDLRFCVILPQTK